MTLLHRCAFELLACALGLCLAGASVATLAVTCEAAQRGAPQVVADIMRADYRADRAALARLVDELTPVPTGGRDAALVRYWRGYAWWRRAINGFNDDTPVAELIADLRAAVDEFERALEADESSVDARAGRLSSIGLLFFANRADPEVMKPQIPRAMALLAEARDQHADHPRMIWVLGQASWNMPPSSSKEAVAARQRDVLASYERGLRAIRAAPRPTHPLEPTWGEPELLMSLAWGNLNRVERDLEAAERHARAALALVPDWHYVRDILLPQILKAKAPRD